MSESPEGAVRALSFSQLDAATAYAVWRLRQQVFLLEQGSLYPDLDGRDLEPATQHFVLEEDGEVVGYARVVDDDAAARLGRVVVTPDARGRGLADALVRAALDATSDRAVVLDSQTEVAGWYASFGFEVTGPEFDDDGVLHLPMRRAATGHI